MVTVLQHDQSIWDLCFDPDVNLHVGAMCLYLSQCTDYGVPKTPEEGYNVWMNRFSGRVEAVTLQDLILVGLTIYRHIAPT